jgi:hypothetical protein
VLALLVELRAAHVYARVVADVAEAHAEHRPALRELA